MGIERKLESWVAAGVIDQPTAARIATHEAAQRRPVLLYALGGLGAVTIGIGTISVVAANWDAIPAGIKLAGDVGLGLALAVATRSTSRRGARWGTEILVIVSYLFALASLALVGQVYQTGTPAAVALSVWTVSTAPLVFLGRSVLLAFVFYAGFVTTASVDAVWLLETLDDRTRGDVAEDVALALAFAGPIALLALARTPPFARWRPAFGVVFRGVTLVAVALAAFAVQFVWYGGALDARGLAYGWLGAALVAIACWVSSAVLFPAAGHRAWAALVSVALVSTFLSGAIEHDGVPAVGAAGQLVVLAVLGAAALQAQALRAFHALTALIALRVLVAYFEVFGSMMSTGVAMITGGGLTLVLAYLWKRQSPVLAAELERRGRGA